MIAADRKCKTEQENRKIMMNTIFLVKIKRTSTRDPQYVQRIDRTSIETTTDRKLALMMGKFTAQDAISLIQNSRCTPELVPVQVPS
jgi:hypothetical protein